MFSSWCLWSNDSYMKASSLWKLLPTAVTNHASQALPTCGSSQSGFLRNIGWNWILNSTLLEQLQASLWPEDGRISCWWYFVKHQGVLKWPASAAVCVCFGPWHRMGPSLKSRATFVFTWDRCDWTRLSIWSRGFISRERANYTLTMRSFDAVLGFTVNACLLWLFLLEPQLSPRNAFLPRRS